MARRHSLTFVGVARLMRESHVASIFSRPQYSVRPLHHHDRALNSIPSTTSVSTAEVLGGPKIRVDGKLTYHRCNRSPCPFLEGLEGLCLAPSFHRATRNVSRFQRRTLYDSPSNDAGDRKRVGVFNDYLASRRENYWSIANNQPSTGIPLSIHDVAPALLRSFRGSFNRCSSLADGHSAGLRRHESNVSFTALQNLLAPFYPRGAAAALPLMSRQLHTKPPRGFEKFYPKSDREGRSLSQRDPGDAKPAEGSSSSKGSFRSGAGASGAGDSKSSEGGDSNEQRGKRVRDPIEQTIWLILALFGVFALLDTSQGSNEVTFQEFANEYLVKGLVESIQVVNKEKCRAFLASESSKPEKSLTFRLGSTTDNFERKIEMFQAAMGIHPKDFIPIRYVNEMDLEGLFEAILPSILSAMVFIFLVSRTMKNMGGGAGRLDRLLSQFKARAVTTKDMKTKVKFADVAGMRGPKREVSELVDFLKDPKKYEHLGARIPKGALLCGPPGTGKTLLAKAVAGEADVPFYSMSGSDFIEVFVGVGPSRVRDLFAQARKTSPSIVFIDEIDAVGRKRGKGGFGGSDSERENTLNQLLVEMDGFTTQSGVVVLAGTNRIDILDPALMRPGRFDRTVSIEKPDLEERQEIYKIHLKPLKLAPHLNFEELSKRLSSLTPGTVGADISNICNEAAIQGARRDALDGVDEEDFERATERVLAGLPKESRLLSELQKKTVVYHEVGHALVGWFLEHADPVLKVTIVPRASGALGFAQHMPDNVQLFSRASLLDKIAVILGGRAAEEVFMGAISTGATDDLDKVTKMCYAYVSQWGMNPEVGLVSFQNDSSQQFYRPYSESTAQLIDREVRTLIEDQYNRVKKLLVERAESVHKLAKVLLAKETISYTDIVECVGERPFPMKGEFASFVRANPRAAPKIEESDNQVEAKEHCVPNGDLNGSSHDGGGCASVNDPTSPHGGESADISKTKRDDGKSGKPMTAEAPVSSEERSNVAPPA